MGPLKNNLCEKEDCRTKSWTSGRYHACKNNTFSIGYVLGDGQKVDVVAQIVKKLRTRIDCR